MLFLSYTVCMSIFKYKVYGFTLWMQIPLLVGTILLIAFLADLDATATRLIKADSQTLSAACDNFFKALDLYENIGALMFDLSSYLVHWIFAMKYWSLSIKL